MMQVTCDTLQLVDDKVLEALVRGCCGAAGKQSASGAAVAQAGDGVRKFQMGGVPDRGGSTLDVGVDT